MTAIHLTFDCDTQTAIERKDAAARIADSEGWDAFMAGVEQRKLQLMNELTYGNTRDDAASYERILGQIRGLDQVEGILDGVIQHGRRAEAEARLLEESIAA